MQVEFAFGKSPISLQLPEGFRYRLLKARSAAPLAGPAAAIERGLDAPLAGPPLAELARGKKSAAISVCDITRPVPNREILPPMLRRLERAGIARPNILILIATGSHRAATPAEIEEICGGYVAENYAVANHDGADLSAHQDLGATPSGTRVYLDRRFIAADLHITVGFIEPHLMAGFSGGRKLVAPGLAATETIKTLHSPRFMRDPRAVEGSLENNPLHRELLEIARMARHDFMLDVALARNAERGPRAIAGVFAGAPAEAHAAGAEFVARVMRESLPEPVDAVITTAAGYPLDLTFYQAVKGVTAAAHVVKPGGKILLLAACDEGIGGGQFARLIEENPSDRAFLEKIARAPVIPNQWQLEKLALVTQKAEVSYYVPGLPRRYASSVWGAVRDSAGGAVAALARALPPNASVALIPEGPYVLASLDGEQVKSSY
ncbi:MAG TPA: nickel-dependent lactate racemase [Candidatus Acidoferrales bacterium]|nr:nickel-dependent lactate racemase [Candidatus Acidoferrales bacterium]